MPHLIDPTRLEAALDLLDRDELHAMLSDALNNLAKRKLTKVVRDHLDIEELTRYAPSHATLLTDIETFHAETLAGKHYDSFNVNSKNYMEMSNGTKRWIARHGELVSTCVNAVKDEPGPELGRALTLLLDLLVRIDDGRSDVFFADEAGSFQVIMSWMPPLKAWIQCIAGSDSPEVYAAKVCLMVAKIGEYDSAGVMTAARKHGTPDQRKALKTYEAPSYPQYAVLQQALGLAQV